MTPFGQHPADGELARYLRALVTDLRGRVGADACDWNGHIHLLPIRTASGQPELRAGFADWDGTMGLRTDLLDALRTMWGPSSGGGEPRQRDALNTVRHETVHFLRMEGQRYADGEPAYRRWAVRLLEEGVTEAVAQNHRRAGAAEAEARVPGLARLPPARTYREFTPAVRELAQYVGELKGRPAGKVLDDLGRQAPQAKYARLTRLILEGGGLWERIPESQRAACQRHLEDELSTVAWSARAWARRDEKGQLGTPDPEGRSHVLGLQMVAAAERARLRIEHEVAGSRSSVPWQLAAARYENRRAADAVRRAATRAPDVRDAAQQWRDAVRARVLAQQPAPGPEAAHDRDGPAMQTPAAPTPALASRTGRFRGPGRPLRRSPGARPERDLGR